MHAWVQSQKKLLSNNNNVTNRTDIAYWKNAKKKDSGLQWEIFFKYVEFIKIWAKLCGHKKLQIFKHISTLQKVHVSLKIVTKYVKKEDKQAQKQHYVWEYMQYRDFCKLYDIHCDCTFWHNQYPWKKKVQRRTWKIECHWVCCAAAWHEAQTLLSCCEVPTVIQWLVQTLQNTPPHCWHSTYNRPHFYDANKVNGGLNIWGGISECWTDLNNPDSGYLSAPNLFNLTP